jgi:isocitrate dehydrogenase
MVTLVVLHSIWLPYTCTVDNVEDLAHHFFSRCLSGLVVPYVVTKKTVFKWQASKLL